MDDFKKTVSSIKNRLQLLDEPWSWCSVHPVPCHGWQGNQRSVKECLIFLWWGWRWHRYYQGVGGHGVISGAEPNWGWTVGHDQWGGCLWEWDHWLPRLFDCDGQNYERSSGGKEIWEAFCTRMEIAIAVLLSYITLWWTRRRTWQISEWIDPRCWHGWRQPDWRDWSSTALSWSCSNSTLCLLRNFLQISNHWQPHPPWQHISVFLCPWPWSKCITPKKTSPPKWIPESSPDLYLT